MSTQRKAKTQSGQCAKVHFKLNPAVPMRPINTSWTDIQPPPLLGGPYAGDELCVVCPLGAIGEIVCRVEQRAHYVALLEEHGYRCVLTTVGRDATQYEHWTRS